MGYNSNLSKKDNKAFGATANKHHPLWITGTVLRILGLLVVIPALIMIINAGGWGFLFLFNPLTLAGALLLAFGQYFVSNWKNK